MNRLLVILSAVCFGTTGTAQALGAAGASPVSVGAARVAVGAAGLHLVAHWVTRAGRVGQVGQVGRVVTGGRVGRGSPGRWHPARWLPASRLMWLAAVGVAGYQVAFFLAVRATGVAVGTVVALGSAPVVTGAVAWLLGQPRPGRRWYVATGLAVAGLAVLTTAGGRSHVAVSGVLLALGAGLSYAIYTVAVKDALGRGEPAERTMATLFTGGALLLSPALVLLPADWLGTPRGAAAALWLGLVPTALAYVLFARGLRGISAAEASTLTLAEPLTAATLGVVLLGESLSGAALTGAVLLLLGLVVLSLP